MPQGPWEKYQAQVGPWTKYQTAPAIVPSPAGPSPDERTAGQVASDQAVNVLKGVPRVITGIPSTIAELMSMAKSQLLGKTGEAASTAGQLLKGVLAPFTTTLQGAGALIAPNSVEAPTRKDFEQAAQGAGTNAAALALPAMFKNIPTTAKAGVKFEKVMAAARDVPINTTTAEAVLARAKELKQRGSSMPKVMSDFFKDRAAATPATGPATPMTYGKGRDFASNASAMSSRDITRTNAKMQAQVSEFSKAMKEANREAAVKVGMGELYDQAMKEYRQAKTLQEAGQVLKTYGVKAAWTALAGAAGYELIRHVIP